MSALRETFAKVLRATRVERELTQAALAELTGLEPCAISHFEAARRTPHVENLVRLANALNCTTDSLLGR